MVIIKSLSTLGILYIKVFGRGEVQPMKTPTDFEMCFYQTHYRRGSIFASLSAKSGLLWTRFIIILYILHLSPWYIVDSWYISRDGRKERLLYVEIRKCMSTVHCCKRPHPSLRGPVSWVSRWSFYIWSKIVFGRSAMHMYRLTAKESDGREPLLCRFRGGVALGSRTITCVQGDGPHPKRSGV